MEKGRLIVKSVVFVLYIMVNFSLDIYVSPVDLY